jgi:hypothetical protein
MTNNSTIIPAVAVTRNANRASWFPVSGAICFVSLHLWDANRHDLSGSSVPNLGPGTISRVAELAS